MASAGTEASVTVEVCRAPFAGRLIGARVIPAVVEAASDTNYHSVAIVNAGDDGAGTTEMALGTSKTTGGTAYTAHEPNALTLDSTVADRAFAEGDVLSAVDTIGGTTTANLITVELDLTRDA
jgi:hypothetical protein